MKGIKAVVTYQCNFMCNHCQYKCGPHKRGIMDVKNFKNNIIDSYSEGFKDYIIIEGGEPFLYSGIIYKYLKCISGIDIKKYITTNGFWGNFDSYIDIIEDMKRVGLCGLIFEYDYFHSAFINIDIVKEAVLKCKKCGIDISFKACFTTGDLRSEADFITLQYVKEIRKEFKDTRFLFDDISRKNNIFSSNTLLNEKRILFKA